MTIDTPTPRGRRGAVRRLRWGLGAILVIAPLPLGRDPVAATAPSDTEYTSPTYGYSISWDPAVWTDADAYVGSYDSLSLANGSTTTFMLSGTDVFHDLATCVSENIAGFSGLGEFTTATDLVGPVPAPGAEAALTTAEVPTDTGATVEMAAYVECRWVTQGESTVAITLLTAAAMVEKVVPLYETLIATLVIPGASSPADSTQPATSVANVVPTASQPPTGLGDDPALNALAQSCFDGDMVACDDLYAQSAVGSPYEDYGDTCAGRQPLGTGLLCVDTFAAANVPAPTQEPTGLGEDPALDALAQSCFGGDMAACDELYAQSAADSPYERYGDTCAGRQPLGTGRYCADAFTGAAPTTPPSTTAPTAPPPASPVSSPPTPVATAGAAGPVDPTSEAALAASMLQPGDVSPGAESSGIGPDDDVDLPGWTDNGGIRALSQTVADDVITAFDFRWQFPDAASAAAFLDAAESELSEVSIGSEAAVAPVTPVPDTRYYTFSSNLFTPVVGFNYLMRYENIVAKVYVSGSEDDVSEEDAATIARLAGDRMTAAAGGSVAGKPTASATTANGPVPSTAPAAPTTAG